MRRGLSTCSSQSAMRHGVPVRVFFRRSWEHHSRNDSSSSTSWSHDSHVFFHSCTLIVPGTFLRVLYNIHHQVAFARELEEKTKNTEQDQPAVRSAVAAAAEAAAAEASSSNSNSSSSSRKAEAAEDAESTSEHDVCTPYTAVRDFSVQFLKTKKLYLVPITGGHSIQDPRCTQKTHMYPYFYSPY